MRQQLKRFEKPHSDCKVLCLQTMNAAVLKFRQELSDSVELQEKLKFGNSVGDFVALAKENGRDFTEEEVKSTFAAIKDSDEGLTDFELEADRTSLFGPV